MCLQGDDYYLQCGTPQLVAQLCQQVGVLVKSPKANQLVGLYQALSPPANPLNVTGKKLSERKRMLAKYWKDSLAALNESDFIQMQYVS